MVIPSLMAEQKCTYILVHFGISNWTPSTLLLPKHMALRETN